MGWVVVGGALVLAGALLAWRTSRNATGEREVPGRGLALALGLALMFWGAVAVIVGLAVRAL